jgi:hypothetical protein
MWLWIVLVVLAVMAALLIYAACCVDGDINRQSEAHPPKQYYSSGVDVADMIRVTGAVSAKMAAERGIKRVPLAVLSQSEVTRRMKTI